VWGEVSSGAALDDKRERLNAVPCGSGNWARVPLSTGQKVFFGLLAVGIAAAAIDSPTETGIVVVATFAVLYNAHLLFRTTIWVAGLPAQQAFAPNRPDSALPVYSIIVPLYREANMMTGILAALDRLDYPRDRLDVLLAIECDDADTITALKAATLPPWVRPVLVPQGEPRTKPRACNHALTFARGSFTVVYDAEDRPEPAQLKEAIAAFDRFGPSVSCLQARLMPFNAHESFVSRMFALDYCQWFDSTLPGLQRLGMPVPLGGTSNHFRTRALIASGAWDSWNVTEDADLGIRLARLGHGVRTIPSTTFEEAPVTFAAWLPQRARWIKGYLQTFLVHIRTPASLDLPPLGFGGVMCLVFFVGASVVFALVNPVFWAILLYSFAIDPSLFGWAFDGAVGPMAAVSMFAGNGAGVLIATLSPIKRGAWRLMPWGLATPVYWLMLSTAAWRALYSFIVAPFHWAKTAHGLTKSVAGEIA
jgi:cellulose synthase/poly-beta-1,6-N-acetylglucosamine synthase-like glycosyltransferase